MFEASSVWKMEFLAVVLITSCYPVFDDFLLSLASLVFMFASMFDFLHWARLVFWCEDLLSRLLFTEDSRLIAPEGLVFEASLNER